MSIILAIDDRKDNLLSLSALLKSTISECHVITALSGYQGIEMAKTEKPDTILLDINMPEMDGFEACRILKSNSGTKHIPVIMLTAVHTGSESRVKGLEIGADAFLVKPIDQFELAAQVKAMLRIKYAEDIMRTESNLLEQQVAERTADLVKKRDQLILEIEERKLAEAALKESEEKYRALFERDSDAIFIYDPDTTYILDVNEATSKMYGYSKDELIGMSCLKLSAETKESADAIDKIHEDDEVNIPVRLHCRKDGTVFPVDISGYTITLNGKKLMYGVSKDITRRKQAEDDLKFSAERFERWKSSSPIGIIQSNSKGGINDVNDTILKMLGYSRQDMLEGRLDWTKLTPPEFLHLDKKAMEEAADKGYWTPFEKEYIHKDGHRVPIIIGGSVFKEHADEYIVFIIDISRRKQVEAQLEKLSIAVQQSPVSTIITDLEGKIEYVNPKFCDLTGYSSEEVTGKKPGILQSDTISGEIYEILWETILDGKEWRGELQNKKKNGEIYWVDVVISGIFNNKGDISHFLIIKEDITKRKQIEAKLLQTQKMESIGTLAGGIAHDFNNILFPIVGHTEMLIEDTPKDSPLQENLNEIYSGALRASELVKQILTRQLNI